MIRLLTLLLLFISVGCTSKIATLKPLETNLEQQVKLRFQEYEKRQCTGLIDSDVKLHLDIPGEDINASGILMIKEPGSIHFRMTDPMGRTMMMLVSDGLSFTFADNRKGEGYVGMLDSEFWTQYVPAGISSNDFFSWLSGRLPPGSYRVAEVGEAGDSQCCWFVLDYKDSGRHHIEFDAEEAVVKRHFLEKDGNVVFDASYTYGKKQDDQCQFPEQVQIDSTAFTGIFTLRFDKIYPTSTVEADKFNLTLPDHYTVHAVD